MGRKKKTDINEGMTIMSFIFIALAFILMLGTSADNAAQDNNIDESSYSDEYGFFTLFVKLFMYGFAALGVMVLAVQANHVLEIF